MNNKGVLILVNIIFNLLLIISFICIRVKFIFHPFTIEKVLITFYNIKNIKHPPIHDKNIIEKTSFDNIMHPCINKLYYLPFCTGEV